MKHNSLPQLHLGFRTGKPSTGRSESLGKACRKCQSDQWYVRLQGGRRVHKCVNCLRAWKRQKRRKQHPLQDLACRVCGEFFQQRRGNQVYCNRSCLKTANIAYARRSKDGRRDVVGGACEVCGVILKQRFWDHDHATGDFRGWLCNGCNAALGFARDNPATLRALATYLERHFINEKLA